VNSSSSEGSVSGDGERFGGGELGLELELQLELDGELGALMVVITMLYCIHLQPRLLTTSTRDLHPYFMPL
jgi:hypothetical protein